MRDQEKAARWNDITIADLVFMEKLGSAISAGVGDTLVAVAAAAGLTYAHCHNTLGKLESVDRFHRRLVDRERMALTREGEEVLAYARRVLETYRVRPFSSSRVTLRIAATNRILTTLLASYIPQFMENYRKETGQELNIEILEATFEQLLTWLEVGEVELAFGGASTPGHKHEKLTHKLIRNDLRMILVAPPKGYGTFSLRKHKEGFKASIKELASCNLCLIRRDQRGSFRNLPDPNPGYSRIVVDNYSSVIAMVRAGAAVGLVINYSLPSDLLKFELADTSQAAQSFAVWQRAGSRLSAAAESLRDCIGSSKKRSKAK